jgi:ATP/maltotriose-dependent transcriptional regulator MalT
MLTFISVQARFYKTTLVGEWISNIRKELKKGGQTDRIAWLWLKEGDCAPARFPAYVIAALNRVE